MKFPVKLKLEVVIFSSDALFNGLFSFLFTVVKYNTQTVRAVSHTSVLKRSEWMSVLVQICRSCVCVYPVCVSYMETFLCQCKCFRWQHNRSSDDVLILSAQILCCTTHTRTHRPRTVTTPCSSRNRNLCMDWCVLTFQLLRTFTPYTYSLYQLALFTTFRLKWCMRWYQNCGAVEKSNCAVCDWFSTSCERN